MNTESLQKIKAIQEHVDKLNKVVRNSPYSFTWSPPTNHTNNQELDYFCIHCHCSLVQETKDSIERCHPITLLYYFGQTKMLDERVRVETVAELNDWFHITLGNILSKYLLALTRLSNGDKENVNFQRINQTSDNNDCTATAEIQPLPKSPEGDFVQS